MGPSEGCSSFAKEAERADAVINPYKIHLPITFLISFSSGTCLVHFDQWMNEERNIT
jgi:hypothetical protein